MLLQMRQFKKEDAELLCQQAIEQELKDNPEYYREWAKINEESGPAYTMIVNDKIIGAAGIRLMKDEQGENIGWAWTIFTPLAVKNKFSMIRSILTMMRIIAKDFNLKWLASESKKGFAASQHLLEHLGFRKMNEETETHYYYKLEIG